MAPIVPADKDLLVHARTLQGKIVKSLLDTLKNIVHDVVLTFDATGIKISSMDSSKMAVVYLKLEAESFEEYYCACRTDVGVNVTNLFKLIRYAGNHDSVLFQYGSKSRDVLTVAVQNFEKKTLTTFRMRLLDLDNDIVDIADVQFDTVVVMPAAYLQRLVRDMHDISDHLTIRIDDGVLSFECGADFVTQKTEVCLDSDAVFTTTGAAAGAAAGVPNSSYLGTFELKYLTMFCRAAGISTVAELFFKDGLPLMMSFKIGSLGTLRFIVSSVEV